MSSRIETGIVAAAAAACALTAGPGFGQTRRDNYPERPVRLIVPFPPGGGTDLVSRTILPEWTALMGQYYGITAAE